MRYNVAWKLASALVLFCFLTPAFAADPLPRIRVAGREFRTSAGQRFVPFGVNYFRPGTGWAPKLWKKFDPQATRADFQRLRALGGNCVRVFLTYGSFYNEAGVLDLEGLAKFDQFLAIAEESGVYVHPTGPDHWEGQPRWVSADRFADEKTLAATEAFWRLFAARYKGRSVIWAYDLLNEPMIRWNTHAMQARWNKWVLDRYGSAAKAAQAWNIAPESIKDNSFPIPPANQSPTNPMLLDFQRCRESVADEWTGRQAAAIKAADPDALVTVGFIQWAIPAVISRPDQYAAFNPTRQAKYLDFLEFHFYPLEHGALEYGNPDQFQRNLAYAEACAREVARPGKPVVLAEYGWHGGGTFPMGNAQSKPGTEEDQARWCSALIQTTAPLVTGWLNWGFHDHPEARDVTIHTGLLTPDGKEKAWAQAFHTLAQQYQSHPPTYTPPQRPDLPWDQCITSSPSATQFRDEYLKSFQAP